MSYASEQGILNAQWNAAQEASVAAMEQARPFVLLRPRMFPDGDQWCALYGDDLQSGVAGFGDTPDSAARAFDDAWRNSAPPPHN